MPEPHWIWVCSPWPGGSTEKAVSALEGTHSEYLMAGVIAQVTALHSTPSAPSSDHGSAVKSASCAPPPRQGRAKCAIPADYEATILSPICLHSAPPWDVSRSASVLAPLPSSAPWCGHSLFQALSLMFLDDQCSTWFELPCLCWRPTTRVFSPDTELRFMNGIRDGLQHFRTSASHKKIHYSSQPQMFFLL